jgi:hypothetical protein
LASFSPALAEDKGEMARIAAVEKLTDQGLLAKISVKDKSAVVRKAAVERMTDQTALTTVAMEDKDRPLRKVAAERLTDQTMLAKVALQNDDGNVRKAAIDRLTDQTVLVRAALGDSACNQVATDRQWSCIHYYEPKDLQRYSVPKAAIDRLTDQAALAKVALEGRDETVRLFAVGKLTDQRLLARVALEDKNEDARRVAVSKLTDQTVLVRVVLEDKDGGTRRLAVGKLTDQTVLARVALEGRDETARRVAVGKLTDQTVLARVALEDKDRDARKAAIDRLTNETVLAKIAVEDKTQNGNPTFLSNEAIKRLGGLFRPFPRLGIYCPTSGGRADCGTMLPTDQTLLASFAKNEPYNLSRVAAVQHLWDQPTLEQIAGSSWSNPANDFLEALIRSLAAGAVLDTSALETVAKFWATKSGALSFDLPQRGLIAVPASNSIEVKLAYTMKVILGLRRAIQKSGVENRTGRLRIQLVEDSGGPGQRYQGSIYVEGEEVTIWIGTDTTIFATGNWKSELPGAVSAPPNHAENYFLPAPINPQQIIDYLVRASQ